MGERVPVPRAQTAENKQFLAQDAATIAADTFTRVFTKAAPVALFSSQADSFLPGPGDIGALGIMAGALIVAGAITVYTIATAPAATATSAPPVATATATPTATATTTTTSPPIALPRKWPGQTCENKHLDALEAAKDLVCTGFPGKSCSSSGKNAPFLPVYPCSLLKARIPAVLACVAARQKIQDECFKGSPHAGHAQQIDDLGKGIVLCEALKAINCAPGHPMAGL